MVLINVIMAQFLSIYSLFMNILKSEQYWKGSILMNRKNKSEELLKKALKLDLLKDGDNYVNFLKQAIDEDSANLKPHILLGTYYFKNKKMEEAAEVLSKATKIDYLCGSDPSEASKVYIPLGKIYQTLSKKEESLSFYKDFIGLFPFSQMAEKLARQIYVKLKNFDEWYATYKKGASAFEDGEYSVAVKSFKFCQKSNQPFMWSSFFLARSLAMQGNYEEAQELLLKLSSQRSYYVFSYYLYMFKKELTGVLDEELLTLILQEAPEFMPAVFEQGKIEEQNGAADAAITCYERVSSSGSAELKKEASAALERLGSKVEGKNAGDAETPKNSEKKSKSEPKDRDEILNKAIKEAETITMDAYAEAKMIKAAAEKEAAEILKKAENTHIPFEPASGSLMNPALEKERMRQKRKELEERYDKMVAELSEERKRLRYKALDDAEDLVKAAEKQRSEILAKAQEDAESIINSASLLTERERKHIYDKTLKYSVIAIEEAREKAANEGKSILDTARRERDDLLEKAQGNAALILKNAEKISGEHLQSALEEFSRTSEKTRTFVKSEIETFCDDLTASFNEFFVSWMSDLQKKFFDKTDESIKGFEDGLLTSVDGIKNKISSLVNDFVPDASLEDISIDPDLDDASIVAEESVKPLLSKDEDEKMPALSDIVKETLDSSEPVPNVDFSEMMSEDGETVDQKDDFLDRFVSQKELLDDVDLSALAEEVEEEYDESIGISQSNAEPEIKVAAQEVPVAEVVFADAPAAPEAFFEKTASSEASLFGDAPAVSETLFEDTASSDSSLFGDTPAVSESLFENTESSSDTSLFGETAHTEPAIVMDSENSGESVLFSPAEKVSETIFADNSVEASLFEDVSASAPAAGDSFESASTTLFGNESLEPQMFSAVDAQENIFTEAEDSPSPFHTSPEPTPFAEAEPEPHVFSSVSDEEAKPESDTVFAVEESQTPFTVWDPSANETPFFASSEPESASSDSEKTEPAENGGTSPTEEGERHFGSFLSQFMEDDDEDED